MKKPVLIICCSIFLIIMGSVMFPGIYLANTYTGYHGKVVDADTGAPIEGVVALASWYWQSPFWGTDISDTFVDAEETRTDKDGCFSIGWGRLRSNEQLTLIFKVGYEYQEFYWDTLDKGEGQRMGGKWEGSKAVIPLRKLTKKDRRKQRVPKSSAAYRKKKIPLLMKEINKQEIEFDRQPYPEEEWSP